MEFKVPPLEGLQRHTTKY